MQTRTKKALQGAPAGSTPARVSPGRHPNNGGSSTAGIAVTVQVYEAGRAAWFAVGTLAAVREATGLGPEGARRLIESGAPALGLPSYRDAARVRAAEIESRASKAEARTTKAEADAIVRTLEERARAAKRAQETQTKVLGDAQASREAELRLVRANRGASIVLANVNGDLLRVARTVAESLLDDVGKLRSLGARERMGILRTVAGIVQRTAQASYTAVQMERLLMGEPTAILGHAPAGPQSDMTPDEAEQWLAIANRAFERRRARARVLDASPVDHAPGDEESDTDELGVAQ